MCGMSFADCFAMSSGRRKVLLALPDGEFPPRLCEAALSLCLRLDAELEIFVRGSEQTIAAEFHRAIDELTAHGVPCRVSFQQDLRRRDVVRYANAHECVLSVLIDSAESWLDLARDRHHDPWMELACPLVTVVSAVPK